MTSNRAASARSAEQRILGWLGLVVALDAGLTIAHFAHGAHVYEDPSRYHVVAPALAALLASLLVGGAYARRPSRLLLWGLVSIVGVPFVGAFGLYHGGVNHVAKLLFYAAGVSPERLEEMFDSPDFAIPNDAVFELTGVLTLVTALAIAHLLARLVRAASRGAAVRMPPAPAAKGSL
jgi:hypothetical protein